MASRDEIEVAAYGVPRDRADAVFAAGGIVAVLACSLLTAVPVLSECVTKLGTNQCVHVVTQSILNQLTAR